MMETLKINTGICLVRAIKKKKKVLSLFRSRLSAWPKVVSPGKLLRAFTAFAWK